MPIKVFSQKMLATKPSLFDTLLIGIAKSYCLDRIDVSLPESKWTDSERVVKDLVLRDYLEDVYHIPTYTWEDICHRSNGYVEHTSNRADRNATQEYSCSFRTIVKHVATKQESANPTKDYHWDEMDFFTRCHDSGAMTVLLFDSHESIQEDLKRNIVSVANQSPSIKMAFIMLVLIESLVKLYDTSVWTVRDVIRDIEKARSSEIPKKTDFDALHDKARHAIHTSEVMAVTVDTLTELVTYIDELIKPDLTSPQQPALSTRKLSPLHISSKLHFWLGLQKNIFRRAQAIEKRFTNEIQLAFNLVTQRDSEVQKDMSGAMQKDSAAMRTIAVVTLAFLPPTFVSTVFSMSFFNTSNDPVTDAIVWHVSNRFWLYWAIAIPLTVFTIAVWTLIQSRDNLLPRPPPSPSPPLPHTSSHSGDNNNNNNDSRRRFWQRRQPSTLAEGKLGA